MLSDDEDLAIGLPDFSDAEEAEEDGIDVDKGVGEVPVSSTAAHPQASQWKDGGKDTSSSSDGEDDQKSVPPRLPPEVVCECPMDPTYRLLRWDCRSLSVAAFREMIAETRHPMIITGLHDHLTPRGLSLQRLEKELLPPDLAVPVRGRDGRWDA